MALLVFMLVLYFSKSHIHNVVVFGGLVVFNSTVVLGVGFVVLAVLILCYLFELWYWVVFIS